MRENTGRLFLPDFRPQRNQIYVTAEVFLLLGYSEGRHSASVYFRQDPTTVTSAVFVFFPLHSTDFVLTPVKYVST